MDLNSYELQPLSDTEEHTAGIAVERNRICTLTSTRSDSKKLYSLSSKPGKLSVYSAKILVGDKYKKLFDINYYFPSTENVTVVTSGNGYPIINRTNVNLYLQAAERVRGARSIVTAFGRVFIACEGVVEIRDAVYIVYFVLAKLLENCSSVNQVEIASKRNIFYCCL